MSAAQSNRGIRPRTSRGARAYDLEGTAGRSKIAKLEDYAAVGGPNQVVSASRDPASVPSPVQAT
jgi:hypothetical protein